MGEVEIRREHAVLWITLNRPDALNALNAPMHAGLAAALDEARDPSLRAVVLTGAGRGFCAGQDVEELRDGPHTVSELLRERLNPLVLALRGLEKPVLAAVNGPAAGAGLSLALACDARIAAESAAFVPGFAGLGLAPDSGASLLAARLLGAGRAFEWLATGRRLDAQEALAWGLVSEVVADGELPVRAAEAAERLAALPTRAVWETRRLVDLGGTATLEQQLENEARAQGRLVRTPDFAEGVAAFAERRPPAFTGAEAERVHPVELRIDDDRRRWRLTVALRGGLVLPHLALACLWTLAAVPVGIANWLIALWSGRPPRQLHAWLARYVRYLTHVAAYATLVADPFPPFRGWAGTYPVDLAVEPSARQPRWKTALRLVLALPALLLASVLLFSVLPAVAVVGWFAAVAIARMPKGLQALGAYCVRYSAQTAAYLLLLTDRYPTLASGDSAQYDAES